jgi:hypothetical protein
VTISKASDDHEDASDIFGSILIDCEMDCSKGASSYLLLDDILIDAMFSDTVIFARDIFRSRIERLLYVAV